MLGRKGAKERGSRARDEAQREYESKRNMRPVKDPPSALVEALHALAAQADVRWVTMAESRDPEGKLSRLLIGVRLGPGPPARFAAVETAVQHAVRDSVGKKMQVEVVELETDVDDTLSDGSVNPYVVVRPA